MSDHGDDLAAIRDELAALQRQLDAIQTELETATNRDIPLLKGTIKSLMDAEPETGAELPAAGRKFGQGLAERGRRLDALEARLAVLDEHTDTSTKAEKIAAVLAFAQNKANARDKVAVTPAEIRGCTGVSRRYAYDLVDAIATDVDGATVRESQRVETGNGTKRKQKALLLDCEQVHDRAEAVNEFTTPDGGEDTQNRS